MNLNLQIIDLMKQCSVLLDRVGHKNTSYARSEDIERITDKIGQITLMIDHSDCHDNTEVIEEILDALSELESLYKQTVSLPIHQY